MSRNEPSTKNGCGIDNSKWHVVCMDCDMESVFDLEGSAQSRKAGHESTSGHEVAVGELPIPAGDGQ